MGNVETVENPPQTTVLLSPEETQKAVSLVRTSIKRIISQWTEYREPRLLEQGLVKEFTRTQGQNGEGLWEVEDDGPYINCNLANSGGKWILEVQSRDEHPHRDPLLSVQRIKREGEREIPESPPNNSKAALGLIMEFVKKINGGEIPPEPLELSNRG
ncbi:hypothetical protein A2867_04770 [Candidatus Daviesbacteria bacterium RIFCSPHIGHO2_01_FULL_40_11]|uniref:Uncharacterized protein n=1 Tax=Candidatus Daviesbacteria bacterium RIFCSPHIGHO2_01_FULL_40_11 TaxID=1797762 RepID=A0A1F5JI17_9BACT|nr:MAG: hypothetical protein A2867_04770 [Candidatus Daviesbacteria bacterium RIFCSPHIGHO2_01_FULL_40_11]OGE62929.1 MAG: hypothetical protein A2964_00265 [Candidatus Daviesbacteria bacterium RIFCSPLOWO2_01_FULL_40_27]